MEDIVVGKQPITPSQGIPMKNIVAKRRARLCVDKEGSTNVPQAREVLLRVQVEQAIT